MKNNLARAGVCLVCFLSVGCTGVALAEKNGQAGFDQPLLSKELTGFRSYLGSWKGQPIVRVNGLKSPPVVETEIIHPSSDGQAILIFEESKAGDVHRGNRTLVISQSGKSDRLEITTYGPNFSAEVPELRVGVYKMEIGDDGSFRWSGTEDAPAIGWTDGIRPGREHFWRTSMKIISASEIEEVNESSLDGKSWSTIVETSLKRLK